MKKTAAALLTMMILLLFSAVALAGGPTNPKRQEVFKAFRRLRQAEKDDAKKRGQEDYSVNIEISGVQTVGETLSITASVSGPVGEQDLEFIWWIIEDADPDTEEGISYYHKTKVSAFPASDMIEYDFLYAGEFYCYFSIVDPTTNPASIVYQEPITLSIEGDITLADRVNEIVQTCSSSSKWQHALNLYDWLMDNVYYDSSLTYYGPDILFRGYGVCDGYSKAYMLLCNAAGIPVERATSPSHAWNTIQLNGEWYQVDATWDDPGTGSIGDDNHDFFCLNSEIMQSIDEHKLDYHAGPHATACESLDGNYYIYKGLWQNWGIEQYDESGQWYIASYSDMIADTFNQGNTLWNCNDKINGWYQIRDKLLMYAINREGITLENGGPVTVKATYLGDDGYTFSLTGWNIPNAGVLTMPDALEMVDESTFENVAGSIIRLSAPCSEIASRAFADSQVRTVYIPDSVQSIASDAFEGCGRLLFVTNNAAAIQYAADNNYLVIAP